MYLIVDYIYDANKTLLPQLQYMLGRAYFYKNTITTHYYADLAVKYLLLAKENGCSKMACDVYEKNNYAFAYYQKKGFKKCKTISTRKYILFSMERNLQ